MHYEDLESWQLEELANRVHETVGFFNRLQKRINSQNFPRDRMYEVVTDAQDKVQTLGFTCTT